MLRDKLKYAASDAFHGGSVEELFNLIDLVTIGDGSIIGLMLSELDCGKYDDVALALGAFKDTERKDFLIKVGVIFDSGTVARLKSCMAVY